MALFRKLFYRKPPDGLLEISERVYVFDSCFTTDVWDEKNYKNYVGNVINELREQFVEPSILVFNFRDAEYHSRMANALSEYDMTIMDYPRHYESCPLLPMEVIHHFLRSSESWLSLGQHNLLIMHCERGGWPVLAFMLAALLLYRRQYSGEQKTLDMVYKQAPRELLHLLAPLNPVPSQLRYLQYISRRNLVPQWPPLDRALSLDCVIIRMIPNVDGGGCRPVFRIYGPDPALVGDRTPKVLYSTPKKSKAVRHYKQAECELVKIDINCNIHGDVVLECISLYDDLEREKMVFRAMFNTAFIRSNILILNRDDIDIFWDGKDQFPKDFRAEILFSEMDAAASMVPMDMSCFAEKEGLPEEAFAKVNEIFNSVDWLVPNAEAALNAIQQVAAANVAREMFGTHGTELNALAQQAVNDKIQEIVSPLAFEGIGKVSSPASNPFLNVLEAGRQVPTLVSPPYSSAAPSPPPPVTPPLMEKLVSRTRQEAIPPPPPPPPKLQDSHSAPSIHVEKYTGEPLSLASPLQTQLSPATPKREDKYKRDETSSASALPPPFTPPATEKTASRTPPPPPPPPKRLSHESSPVKYTVADTAAQLLNTFSPKSLPSPATPMLQDKDKRSTPSLPELPNIASTLTKSVTQKKVPPPPPPPPPLSSSLPENEGPRTGSILPSPPPPASSQPGRASSVLSIPPSLPPPPPHPTLRPSAPSLIESSSLPPPPPPPPPTSRESSVFTSGAPQPPPPPPPPVSPMKQSSASKCGPPPPPPPPISPMKQSSALPPPPPPPPMHSGVSNSSVTPPPPPPPMIKSSSAPSAPPPPMPPKGGKVSPSPPPPSAPLPGAKGKSILSRTLSSKNSQTKKLKPLHWLKLTRAVQGSLWAEAQKSGEAAKAPDIDISELESLFSAAVPTSDQGSGSKGTSRGSLNKKPEKVQLVDHRRAYNCEIMLSKVKIPLPDLLSSVLALEDSAMDVDQVENLIKFCPTKEEMELLKGYKGERDKLGKCEQFFLEMMQVPRIEQKLRVFSFKIQFHTQVSELQKNLNNVNSAADQIRNSAKLKRIMQTILSLGNALNQGTARGSAVGFRLDSLLKLTETRARNNKMTLMHYLCKVLVDKLPELLDFSKDLSSLEAASKIQLKFLAEEMQAVSKGLEKVVQELSMAKNDGPVSEQFCKALTEFLSYAEGEVRHLALSYSGVGRNVDALILYFGEDPSRCPFEQVMSTILNFVRMFNQAHEENCKQIELEKKKAEKEAAAAGKLKINPPVKETESMIASLVKS